MIRSSNIVGTSAIHHLSSITAAFPLLIDRCPSRPDSFTGGSGATPEIVNDHTAIYIIYRHYSGVLVGYLALAAHCLGRRFMSWPECHPALPVSVRRTRQSRPRKVGSGKAGIAEVGHYGDIAKTQQGGRYKKQLHTHQGCTRDGRKIRHNCPRHFGA